MDIKRSTFTSGILAVLTAAVLACGTIQGASGKVSPGTGGGDNYLTANDTYGQGVQSANNSGSGPSVAPTDALNGPQLQP